MTIVISSIGIITVIVVTTIFVTTNLLSLPALVHGQTNATNMTLSDMQRAQMILRGSSVNGSLSEAAGPGDYIFTFVCPKDFDSLLDCQAFVGDPLI
jgi:hypothetical protein